MNTFSLLPGCRIEEIKRVGSRLILVAAQSRRTHARCPDCGRVSEAVHSNYFRHPADLAALGYQVRLSLRVRRFYCRNGACPTRTFAERLPLLLTPHARRTRRLATAQGRIGVALGGEAGARLSCALTMPVSADTVLRLVRRLPLPSHEPPRVVGVDDWAIRKGRTYGTILVDLERRRVVDLLPDRSAATLAQWLRGQPGIAVITRDRSTEYARGAAMGAAQAVQVADRWHLLLNTRQMVERWLAGAQARLRRLPSVPVVGEERSARRTRAYPRTRAEVAARANSRAHWLALYEEVRQRSAVGQTLLGISRALGLSRGTVRKFAHADQFPERAVRAPGPSLLDPFLDHLEARRAEGCENGMALWREIQVLGFEGTSRQVHRWLSERRSKPAKTTPRRWRTVEPVRQGEAAPALPSPRHLAWLLVPPSPIRDASEAAVVARVEQDEEAAMVAGRARRFTALMRAANTAVDPAVRAAELEVWLTDARSCGIAPVETFAAGLEQDGAAVKAALTTPWSNGQTEGQITRLKLLKRQMYGRANFDLLRRRTLLAA